MDTNDSGVPEGSSVKATYEKDDDIYYREGSLSTRFAPMGHDSLLIPDRDLAPGHNYQFDGQQPGSSSLLGSRGSGTRPQIAY